MVSLLKLSQVTEEGVRFLSPHDQSPMLLTPEHSMSLQNSIGSDIIMQLDDVIATTSPDHGRIEEATHRSIRWLDRCIAAHKNPKQNLFCIVQGGLDMDLRRTCCKEMVKRNTPGIAIGGLSGGEAKDQFCKVVNGCTSLLPEAKPRYVMGVGYPEDIVVSIALGADMFDCVWPSRTAVSPRPVPSQLDIRRLIKLVKRFCNAIVPWGTLNLRHSSFSHDHRPILEGCVCTPCKSRTSRSFIHHLVNKETVGAHLLTMHNITYMLNLVSSARMAIVSDCFPQWVRKFFNDRFPEKNGSSLPDKAERYPSWAVNALRAVGINLLERGDNATA